jgi:hypothetical protein
MTPGLLVKAVALALDVPEETVVQHDRNLVVAGLRTKGGRGRSAPAVTPLDAARLFVATLGSVRAKDSVGVVRSFEETVFEAPKSMSEYVAEWRRLGGEIPKDDPRSEIFDTKKFDDVAISGLPANHNFIQAVASLISDASLPLGDPDQYLQRFAELCVECDSRFVTARIARVGSAILGGARYERQKPATKAKPSSLPRHQLFAHLFGIRQRREVTGSAIMLMGKAFRDGGLPFDTTSEALDALLGTKKTPAKNKRKIA